MTCGFPFLVFEMGIPGKGVVKKTHMSRARMPLVRPLAAALSTLLAIGSPAICFAASTIVTSCSDSGPGSLRDVVANALDEDFIDLRHLSCSPITLITGSISSSLALHLVGPGIHSLSITTAGNGRIFTSTGSELDISNLTLYGGTSSGPGGCVYAQGNLNIDDSIVNQCTTHTNNSVARGGALYAKGTLTLSGSQISDSKAESDSSGAAGGGVFAVGDFSSTYSLIFGNQTIAKTAGTKGTGGGVLAQGNVVIQYSSIYRNQATNVAGVLISGNSKNHATISNSTIASNTASGVVGGVYSGTALTLRNSTLAFNSEAVGTIGSSYHAAAGLQLYSTTANIQSTIISNNTFNGSENDVGEYGGASLTGSDNLIMTSSVVTPTGTITKDPMLGSIYAHNLTLGFPLLSGSPAIDAGNNFSDLYYDQRRNGNARFVGKATDIGAFETQASGTTTVVGNCSDHDAGSLRNVIANAHSGDTLDLSHLNCSPITLSGELEMSLGNLNLVGPGANALIISGNRNGRVFNHEGYGTLSLSGMTVENGYLLSNSYSGRGGCIASASTVVLQDVTVSGCRVLGSVGYTPGGGIAAKRLKVTDSTISGNSAASTTYGSFGGGIYVTDYLEMDRTSVLGNHAYAGPSSTVAFGGAVDIGATGIFSISNSTISRNGGSSGGGLFLGSTGTIINSTISGNTTAAGGAVAAFSSVLISNSTIADNTSPTSGYAAGISVIGGVMKIESSIVFGNLAQTSEFDVQASYGNTVVGANNIIGSSAGTLLPVGTTQRDPLLGPLRNNGGPTMTQAIASGSPAIDAGNNLSNLATDQRGVGFARVSGKAPDIGAYEFQDTIFENGFE